MSTQDFINTLENGKQYTKDEIIKMFTDFTKKGGKGKRVKKEKDPNAPKKEPNNYMNWCNAHRAEYKSKNPDAKPTELTKLMGAGWRELSDSEKAKWKAGNTSSTELKEEVKEEVKEAPTEVKKNSNKNKKK